jgi:hypothetical protein
MPANFAHRFLVVLTCVFGGAAMIAGSVVSAEPASVRITTAGRSFTVETQRLRVTFEDGMIVALENLQTGERHADAGLDDLGMPRGMGHLRGGVEHVERLHIPWHTSSTILAEEHEIHPRPNRRDDPVYFRPHERSEFSTREIEHGIEAVWNGLTNGEDVFPDDRLTITAWVDAESGRLMFRASAASPDKGVFGVQVPIVNLADYHELYIPSFGGIMVNRQMTTGLKTFGGLKNFLEARVAGIQGRQGSIGLWAQDDLFYNHYLFLHWSGRSFSLAFEHLNLMPFEQHQQTESVVYHLDVFDGGWVDAMTPYRDWYQQTFADQMQQRASVEWADRIRIIIDSFSPDDHEMYAQVAEMFDPGTVLFHEWNARAPGFDSELPDWTPREGYASRVRDLQSHGFRTMAYVNTYCVNYNSPVFKRDKIADFGLTRKMTISQYSNRRVGEDQASQWQGFHDGQLLYLDPLSPRWREYHTDMMIDWHRQTGTDANYEDVLGTAGDFGNGVVDGLFAGQGGAAQTRDLLQRNTAVPMASEYAPENVAFGVRWPLSYLTVWGSTRTRLFWTERTRPISAYIHGPLLRPWVPILRTQDDVRRHWVMAWSDGLGGLAQLRGGRLELDAVRGAQALLNYRAQRFSSLQLEPHFPRERFRGDVVGMFRDRDGGLYEYHVTPTLQQMLASCGRPLYQRIRGKGSFESPLSIAGWPAYRDRKLIGLNPQAYYGLVPRRDQPPTSIRIVGLPEGVMVRRYYEREEVSVVALERLDDRAGAPATVELFTNRPVRQVVRTTDDRTVIHEGTDVPAWDEQKGRSATTAYTTTFPAYFVFLHGPVAQTGHGYVGDDKETGIHVIPDVGLDIGVDWDLVHRRIWPVPYVGKTGEPGMESFRRTSSQEEVMLDYLVQVPDDTTSLLVYSKNAQNVHGNGTIARLYLNGKLVRAYDFGAIANPDWKPGVDGVPSNLWPERRVHQWKVPLGHLAGQPVLISLGTDSRKCTNADNFWWSRPILIRDRHQVETYVALTEDGELAEEPSRVLDTGFILQEGTGRTPCGY